MGVFKVSVRRVSFFVFCCVGMNFCDFGVYVEYVAGARNNRLFCRVYGFWGRLL